MLPPFEECRRRIQIFDSRYPSSTFDEFWSYKLKAERNGGSILDDSHLDDTVTSLVKNLLLRDEWDLWKTGVASFEKIEAILKNVRDDYKIIKEIRLGDGQITNESVKDALSRMYTKFHMSGENCGVDHKECCGITHNCQRDSPDGEGRYFVLGRSKVLMFIWGQTPGFDTWVRRGLEHAGSRSSCWWIKERKWKPSQFCDVLKKLDQWVMAWEEQEGKKFQQTLSPNRNRPAGRIIDIIYWRLSLTDATKGVVECGEKQVLKSRRWLYLEQ